MTRSSKVVNVLLLLSESWSDCVDYKCQAIPIKIDHLLAAYPVRSGPRHYHQAKKKLPGREVTTSSRDPSSYVHTVLGTLMDVGGR